jgi:hypothetical protein
MQFDHSIPELNIDWLQVDLAELQRLSAASFAVPKIEYKIVVSGSYLPFLDWIKEKCLGTVQWEAEEKKKRTRDGARN